MRVVSRRPSVGDRRNSRTLAIAAAQLMLPMAAEISRWSLVSGGGKCCVILIETSHHCGGLLRITHSASIMRLESAISRRINPIDGRRVTDRSINWRPQQTSLALKSGKSSNRSGRVAPRVPLHCRQVR